MKILPDWLKNGYLRVIDPDANWLVRRGVHPNTITAIGTACTVAGGIIYGFGHIRTGGWFLSMTALFDVLDGTVARRSNKSSTFGAFLDSTLDRFSDAALFLGLLAYYASLGAHYQEIVLLGAALTGSLATSYARARAEGLGLKDEVGFFTRTERIILLAIGLLIGHWHSYAMVVVLWIIAVLSNLTALQRIYHVWRQTGGK